MFLPTPITPPIVLGLLIIDEEHYYIQQLIIIIMLMKREVHFSKSNALLNVLVLKGLYHPGTVLASLMTKTTKHGSCQVDVETHSYILCFSFV